MRMQAIKQNGGKTKQWKTMPKAESDAKGCEKTMQKSGKTMQKMQKTGQSAEKEAKRGAKSKQRGGQHALGLQQAKEAIKRKKRRTK